MSKNPLLILGVIVILSSLLIKISLKLTKENDTINVLYSDKNSKKTFRTKLKKLKDVLSWIIFFIGIILIIMNYHI